MASFAQRMTTMGFGPAFALCMTGNIALCAATTSYTRSLGKNYGGASSGQPFTTNAEWRASTRRYLASQKCNPIRHFGDASWK